MVTPQDAQRSRQASQESRMARHDISYDGEMRWGGLVLSSLLAAGGCGGGSGAADAAGGSTGGDSGPNLPACAVGERTPNIADCAEFDLTGAWITPETAVAGDGGITLPGGQLATPAGGTLVDGDYDLVRAVWGMSMQGTRRTIRLSGGGTYTEWEIDNANPQAIEGVDHFRINAPVSATGNLLHVATPGCGATLTDTFGYTAAGDELDLFNFNANALFVYRRTCVRR